jgi:hypothetical protein
MHNVSLPHHGSQRSNNNPEGQKLGRVLRFVFKFHYIPYHFKKIKIASKMYTVYLNKRNRNTAEVKAGKPIKPGRIYA